MLPSTGYAVRITYCPCWWSPVSVVIERITASRSDCWASFGRCSPNSTPGVFVWIGFVSPCSSRPGLGSNVSRWLIAPRIERMIRFMPALPEAAATAVRLPPIASSSVTPNVVRAIRPNTARRASRSSIQLVMLRICMACLSALRCFVVTG
jgi:hypothetical protein